PGPPVSTPPEPRIIAGHGMVKEEPQACAEGAERCSAGPHGRDIAVSIRTPLGNRPSSPHRPSTADPRLSTARARNPQSSAELSPILSTAGENHSRVVPRSWRRAGAHRGRGGPDGPPAPAP